MRRQLLSKPSLAAVAVVGLAFLAQGAWIPAKAALAQILLDRAFAETIRTGVPVKPWTWADTWPVARIAVPRLAQSAIALEGASGQALAFGPGHLAGSALPGESGTAIYAAHRDTQFAFLGSLRPGDEIDVTRADGRSFAYHVTGSTVVPWDNSGLTAAAGEPELALVTCWPLNAAFHGPLRYVVRASLAAKQAPLNRTPPAPATARPSS